MALFKKIQFLKQVTKEKPDGILSIYLDTDRSKPEQQNGQWKVRLKNGLKKLEEYLEAQNALEEKNRFKKLIKKVEKEIYQLQREHQKGLILFASSDLALWELEILQVEVQNEFHWEAQPALEQLQTINLKHPPSGLILAHQNQVRVLDTALGQVLDELDYQWHMEMEDWADFKGPTASSGNQNISREYKKLFPKLLQESKDRNWKAVYLIGDSSLIDSFKPIFDHLSQLYIVPKNLKDKSAHDLLAEVMLN